MTPEFSMRDVAAGLEDTIRSRRLIDVDVPWRDEIVFPHYDGLSLVNLARSIRGLFGAEVQGQLDNAVWGGQVPDVDRVVLFLTDGLGYHLLNERIAQDADFAHVISDLTDGRGPLPMTSIAPSTTAVALPTLWTAQPAAVTGMAGTIMFLRELSILADVLFFRPALGKLPSGSLESMGLNPDGLVQQPSMADQLDEIGVATHLVLDHALNGTGLSRVLHRGVANQHVHTGGTDFWLRAEDVLTQTAGQRAYVSMYWPAVDTQSHFYGRHSRYVLNEIDVQMRNLRDLLARDSVRDGRTAVIIAADHGHYDAPEVIDLSDDTAAAPIDAAMRTSYGAEARFGYLYLREGTRDPVQEVVHRHYRDRLAMVNTETALDAGLFGPGATHPDLQNRLGDMLLLPRLGHRLADSRRTVKPTVSVHGGLSEYEMLVPLMWKVI